MRSKWSESSTSSQGQGPTTIQPDLQAFSSLEPSQRSTTVPRQAGSWGPEACGVDGWGESQGGTRICERRAGREAPYNPANSSTPAALTRSELGCLLLGSRLSQAQKCTDSELCTSWPLVCMWRLPSPWMGPFQAPCHVLFGR